MLHIFRRKRSHNDQDNDIMIIILQPAGVEGGRFCAAHIGASVKLQYACYGNWLIMLDGLQNLKFYSFTMLSD